MTIKFIATDTRFANRALFGNYCAAWQFLADALAEQINADVDDFECIDFLEFSDEENEDLALICGDFGDRVTYRGEIIGFVL